MLLLMVLNFFIPFLIFIILQLLLFLQRSVSFHLPSSPPPNYDKYMYSSFINMFQKTLMIDVLGLDSTKLQFGSINFVTNIVRFVFASVFLYLFMASTSFVPPNLTPIFLYIFCVFAFRSSTSFMNSLIDYTSFLYYLVQNNIENENYSAIFKIYDKDMEYTSIFENAVNAVDEAKNKPFLTRPILSILQFIGTNQKSSQYMILFYIISYIIVKSFDIAHTRQSVEEDEAKQQEENENENENENEQTISKMQTALDVIGKVSISFGLIFAYYLVSVLSLYGGTKLFSYLSTKILNLFDEGYKGQAEWQRQLVTFLVYATKDFYKDMDNPVPLAFSFVPDVIMPFWKNFTLPILFSFLYAYLLTVIFVAWYESNPNRYNNASTHRQKRIEFYVQLLQTALICMTFAFGLLLVFSVDIFQHLTMLGSIALFLLICVLFTFILFY